MSEGIRPRGLPVPPPADEETAALEADLRRRFEAGDPLTDEERRFLARMPASREIPPGEVRAAYGLDEKPPSGARSVRRPGDPPEPRRDVP